MPTLRIHLSPTDPDNQAYHNTNTAAKVATHREVFHVDWKSKMMDQISYPGAQHTDKLVSSNQFPRNVKPVARNSHCDSRNE
jgi:hypothetical protein